MTEAQLERAAELIHTRDEIKEFLSARNPKSALVQEYAKSKYEFQQREAKKIPKVGVAEIVLIDAERCDKVDEPDSLAYWYIARDVLESSLRSYLPKVEAELASLGIKPKKAR